MTKSRTIVSLYAGPSGAHVLCASTRDGASFNVKSQADLRWEDQDPDLAACVEQLNSLVARVKPVLTERATGAYCLHPSWVLSRCVTVPKASRAEVQSFLELWIARQWPEEKFGKLRWNWQPAGTRENKPQSLVLAIRESTASAIEQAFAANHVRAEYATASALAQGQLLTRGRTEKEDILFVAPETQGASVLEMRGSGEPGALHWIAMPGDNAALLTYHLRSLPDGKSGRRLCVAGGTLPPGMDAERISWQEPIRRFVPAVGEAEIAEPEAAAFALLPGTAKLNGALNLVRSRHPGEVVLEKLRPYTEKKKAYKAGAILIALLLISFVGGHFYRAALYADATEAANKFDLDVFAAQQNITFLRKLRSERHPIPDYLLELKNAKLDGVNLDSFQFDKKDMATITGNAQSYTQIEEFTSKLSGSKLFDDAVTQNMQREKKVVNFTIRMKVKKGV